MRSVLARLALSLYPLSFKRRYGDEMRLLIEESPPGPADVLDLMRGAFLAHLRGEAGLGETLAPEERLRASVAGVLACWVAFAAAGVGFAFTTEDSPFPSTEKAHVLLQGSHLAIQALAVIASLSVLVGSLPLVLTAFSRAMKEAAIRVPVGIALAAVASFIGLTALLILIAHSQRTGHPTTLAQAVFIAWGLTGLGCGALCVLGARKALFSMPAPRWQLSFACRCGVLVSAAMIAMALMTAVYAIALLSDSSALATAPNGPLALLSTTASLAIVFVVMALACLRAAISTGRGWRAA